MGAFGDRLDDLINISYSDIPGYPLSTVKGHSGELSIGYIRDVSLIVAKEEGNVLTATENGFGKQTLIKEFNLRKRGGKGVIAIQTSKRNGKLIAANQVQSGDEVIFISSVGNLIRTTIENISVIGRNTQGVKLIRLNEEDKLLEMEPIVNDSNDD